mgnify:CR=1 FL=1
MESNIDDSFRGVLTLAISKRIKATDSQLSSIYNTIIKLAGGDVVYISKQYNQRLSVRNQQLKKDFYSGTPKASLEAKYLLSRHQINRILKA